MGQAQSIDSPGVPSESPPIALRDERPWSASFSTAVYIVPDSREYVQPTLALDRDWLHLEARYNYEALDTASAWVGYNLAVGDKVTLEFTPMLGGVFGETFGIAPGYIASLSWWKLELYTEGEFVIDTGDSSDSFFFTWSELSLALNEEFRFGVAIQRTRLYSTDFDIQHGFFIGLTYQRFDLAAYVFNPDSDPILVMALEVTF